ncbi:MAG: molybdenum cofactor guanylyltransferase [Bacteroidota bacterium]|nr:molybdenum cofactor guanylyltransferase [Bacteroidota bacterium]
MIEKESITGIILAGGKSRRMGREKGLMELKGKPLVEYSIDVLEKVCGNILISTNSHAYDHYPYQAVQDLIPESGPMGGIYSGLVRSETASNLVLSCDTPFVNRELFEYLIRNSPDMDCVVPWHGGEHFEPLCAFYNKKLTGIFYDFIQKGNFKIPDLFKVVHMLPLAMDKNLSFYHENYFFNINSRKELNRAAEK